MRAKDALRPTTQRVVLGIPTLARGNEKFMFNFNELFLKLMAVNQRLGTRRSGFFESD